MRRPVSAGILAIVTVLVAASSLVFAPSASAGDGALADKVLIITTPALRWEDLAEHDLPNLAAFLETSSTALLSMRTIGARTSIGEGYLTLGTGNRASARPDIAGLALEPDEPFEEGTAADAYERRTGERPTGSLLHLGFPSVVQTNDRFFYGARPGSLGQSLGVAGRAGGVVANGDEGLAVPSPPPAEPPPTDPDDVAPEAPDDLPEDETRPDDGVVDADDETGTLSPFVDADYGRSAALMVVDESGQVPVGRVDGLLGADRDAPFGVRYDQSAVMDAFDEVWSAADVTVVELSDLDRADAYRREADPEAAEELWVAALRDSDALFGKLIDGLAGTATAVIVASPSAPRSAESLGVFAMRSMNSDKTIGGLAQSGTTRRAGYVTLPDIAPTVLDLLGIAQPSEMTGTVIDNVADAEIGPERFRLYADATDKAIFRDSATGPISVVFVLAQILAYGLAAVAVARRRRWVRPVSFLALVVLATPTIGFAAGALDVRDADLLTYGLALFSAAIALAGAAEALATVVARRWPRTRAITAPLTLVALNWLLLIVDITTGGRLQINTVFGYSPIVAGRFAGFGNLAFALVAVGATVIACGTWAMYRLTQARTDGSARVHGGAAIVMAVFLGFTVVVDGLPAWGSDVGGVLATVPAFTVLVLVARGVRVDLRRGALIGAATGVVIAVFAAIDLARPESERTHLGRLVSGLLDSEGGGSLGDTLQRKVNTNINILTSSIWTLTIPFALGLMVFLARRNRGFLRDLQEDVPGIRPMLAGGLIVAVLGFALNDSGVAVPAMMFAVLLPYLTYVLLRWDPAES